MVVTGTIQHDSRDGADFFTNTHGKSTPLDKPLPGSGWLNWSLNQNKTKKEPKKFRTWPAPKPPVILPPIVDEEEVLDPLMQYSWFDPNYKYFDQDTLEEPVVPILQKIEPDENAVENSVKNAVKISSKNSSPDKNRGMNEKNGTNPSRVSRSPSKTNRNKSGPPIGSASGFPETGISSGTSRRVLSNPRPQPSQSIFRDANPLELSSKPQHFENSSNSGNSINHGTAKVLVTKMGRNENLERIIEEDVKESPENSINLAKLRNSNSSSGKPKSENRRYSGISNIRADSGVIDLTEGYSAFKNCGSASKFGNFWRFSE